MEKANLSAIAHGPRFLRPVNVRALVHAAIERAERRIVVALATIRHIRIVALDRLLKAAQARWKVFCATPEPIPMFVPAQLLLAAWSVTTSQMERYFARNVKPYVDTPRHKVEGIAVRNEQRAMARV